MERKIKAELIKWKIDSRKKPMLLYGVAECGKTHTILKFGKEEYKNIIYFDCNQNIELNYIFEKNKTLEKLIKGLSTISSETIFPEESLIIFDNVTKDIYQEASKAFINKDIIYDVIMITNDIDLVENKTENSIIKKMNLVTFEEYLKYLNKEQMVDFIKSSFKENKPMPFHTMAEEIYEEYLVTGGYPEAIINYNERKDYNLLSLNHDKIIKLLKYEMSNTEILTDIKKGKDVFDKLAILLLKGQKKVQYGLIKKSSRSRDFETAINYLVEKGIVIKSQRINEIKRPLSKNIEKDNFRIYYNDTGILYKKLNINTNRLLTNQKLINIFYENDVVKTLKSNNFNIYNYHSEGKAQLDIVIQTRSGEVIPIELVKEQSNKSKSLALTMKKFKLEKAMRIGKHNFAKKNNIKYIPYYATFCIDEGMTL